MTNKRTYKEENISEQWGWDKRHDDGSEEALLVASSDAQQDVSKAAFLKSDKCIQLTRLLKFCKAEVMQLPGGE